jgi:hypothetical protein
MDYQNDPSIGNKKNKFEINEEIATFENLLNKDDKISKKEEEISCQREIEKIRIVCDKLIKTHKDQSFYIVSDNIYKPNIRQKIHLFVEKEYKDLLKTESIAVEGICRDKRIKISKNNVVFKSDVTKSVDIESVNTESDVTKSVNTESVNTESDVTKSVNTESDVTKFIDTKSVDTESVDTESVNTESDVTKSVDTESDIKKTSTLPKIKNLDYQQFEVFKTWSDLPIPTNKCENLKYYLDMLDGFYDVGHYTDYIDDLNTIGFSQLKHELSFISKQIEDKIKTDEFILNFKKSLPKINLPDYYGKSYIYRKENANKQFVSVDIRNANWTNIKKISKSFTGSWVDFVKSFNTQSKFILKSKYYRELTFGKAGICKLNRYIYNMLSDFEKIIEPTDFIKNNYIKRLEVTTDEIIYEIIDPEKFNYDQFVEIAKTIDHNFETYRIDMFTLKHYSPFDFFCKEIAKSTNENTIKKQLKCVNKELVMQVIAHIKGKPVSKFDLQFLHNNVLATYDVPLVFDDFNKNRNRDFEGFSVFDN